MQYIRVRTVQWLSQMESPSDSRIRNSQTYYWQGKLLPLQLRRTGHPACHRAKCVVFLTVTASLFKPKMLCFRLEGSSSSDDAEETRRCRLSAGKRFAWEFSLSWSRTPVMHPIRQRDIVQKSFAYPRPPSPCIAMPQEVRDRRPNLSGWQNFCPFLFKNRKVQTFFH